MKHFKLSIWVFLKHSNAVVKSVRVKKDIDMFCDVSI